MVLRPVSDFVTAVKYELPIKVIIVKNNMLGQIRWEQMVEDKVKELV